MLARLIGYDEHTRLKDIIELLHATIDGNAHDVDVIADLYAKTAAVTTQLGLDPQDTTPYELYVSLRKRAVDDNLRLARALHIQHPDAVSEATMPIVRHVKQSLNYHCFAIKSTTLKKILKKNPPRAVMKQLHYRSIDSLLKHESAVQMTLLARYIENGAWKQAYADALMKLTQQDFEKRELEVVWLDKLVLIEELARDRHKHNLVLHAKELGIIAIAPTNEKVIHGYVLRTVLLLEHYGHEVIALSRYLELVSPTKQFGVTLKAAVMTDHDAHIKIAGHPLNWRAAYAAVSTSQIQDILPPHLSADEWVYRHANDALKLYNQHIPFWNNVAHVITPKEEHVTLNAIDIAIDMANQVNFAQRSLKYGRRALEQELFRRYITEPRVHRLLFQRLGV